MDLESRKDLEFKSGPLGVVANEDDDSEMGAKVDLRLRSSCDEAGDMARSVVQSVGVVDGGGNGGVETLGLCCCCCC